MIRLLALLGLFASLAFGPAHAEAAGPKETCIFMTAGGSVRQVNSRDEVPEAFRKTTKCFAPNQHEYLAKPEDIKLEGTTRREDMSSPVGRIQLRWQRKIESLFGRTPMRAMADAARTVSRAVNRSAFPANVRTLNLEWKVIFLDEEMPDAQIPTYLVSACHPGWMTPPANIYIVGQRAAGDCKGMSAGRSRSDSDALLTQILIHEMGHAVEYQLLQSGAVPDRMRAEGFAAWFEQYASEYSSILNKRSIDQYFKSLAQASLRAQPTSFTFQGTAEDYARASMYFNVIVDRRGLQSLMDVYALLAQSPAPLSSAVQSKLSWPATRFEEDTRKFIGEK